MKTHTYTQFKSYVKTYCHDKNTRAHWGDDAHVIHSAWYMFKHNLNEEERIEYLKKDFQNMYKRLYHNGLSLYGIFNDTEKISLKISLYTSGGDMLKYNEAKYLQSWINAVMSFYNIWANLLAEELKNE